MSNIKQIASAYRNIIVAICLVVTFLLIHAHRTSYSEGIIDSVMASWDKYSITGIHANEHKHNTTKSGNSSKNKRPKVDKSKDFYSIGLKTGTDKVGGHHYHNMYTKALQPIREQPLKMLEIGLGCDMNYGPGASYALWLEYLPNVDLYFIEYDGDCVAKWTQAFPDATVFVGDQADAAFLQTVIDESGGDFDIIVDDGGHHMDQLRISYDTLIDALKPGGYYFLEDLATCFMPQYGGTIEPRSMLKYLYEGINELTQGHQAGKLSSIVSYDCMQEICWLTKAGVDGQPVYPPLGIDME